MEFRKRSHPSHPYTSITIALTAIVMLLLFPACGGGRKLDVGAAIAERDSLPLLATKGVSTLISDSGMIRYRIDTEEWLIFDRKDPPHWAFEKGVYLEQFDTLFHKEASIKADTAYYFERDKLWKLKGRVNINNRKGEQFDTELLFWNQSTRKIYSDRFIRIQQPDRIITGYGFDSNEQMTIYTIHNIEGIFYVDEQAESGATSVDSLNNASIAKDSLTHTKP